ncbi:RNase adapter RapZ [Sphingorhabdus sp.]|uniref:RNase adapter RapZ n=1 Tax=Sphingorhabdus sp. TaxID=1902408 RepID=UPI0032B793FC
MNRSGTNKIMLVTGLSGAGKSTVLNTLEDLGWEAVDNFPIRLAKSLLDLPPAEAQIDAGMPLAIGFDSRTRGFEPAKLIAEIKQLQQRTDIEIMTLFLDCAGVEIERRYAETRRRHPLAQDRPAIDGIAQERALMEPLRDWSDLVIDTSRMSASDLQAEIRNRFRLPDGKMTVSLVSFGFSRGVPPNADLIFDLRFLKNPHWDSELRPMTGLDQAVGDYVASDPAFVGAFDRIADLLRYLLPLYDAQGKAYVTIAFGCTGGRHRSVFVTEKFARLLREDGYAPSVKHRNLHSRPVDALEWQGNQARPMYND